VSDHIYRCPVDGNIYATKANPEEKTTGGMLPRARCAACGKMHRCYPVQGLCAGSMGRSEIWFIPYGRV